MNKRTYLGNMLLLVTATIWGFSFIAQRLGMTHVGPFTFNGIRFLIGAAFLVPLLFVIPRSIPVRWRFALPRTLLIGGILFCASSLQQIGIMTTTAGKAGFITGLYVVLVPLLGLFLHHKTSGIVWIGAILAVVGLFLLSVTGNYTVEKGDLLVLVSALFWALHILAIDRFAQRIDGLIIAVMQFFFCGAVSLGIALYVERMAMPSIMAAAGPILYGGIMTIGIAFTLQIYGQKRAHPAHASIILCMESPIAAFGGWIVLGETLTSRSLVGSILMLAGMVLAQLPSKKNP